MGHASVLSGRWTVAVPGVRSGAARRTPGAARGYGEGIMRLTVGPLPPAVYWRRRAVVLGAGLLFLIVLLYSCDAAGDRNTGTRATPTST